MLLRGEEALKEEIQAVELALQESSDNPKEYPKLIARRNVAYQFERLDWNHTVISLNSFNFDYVLRNQNVLVKFFMPWCSYCQSFAPIFVELKEEMTRRKMLLRK